jgi:hypothetical protein
METIPSAPNQTVPPLPAASPTIPPVPVPPAPSGMGSGMKALLAAGVSGLLLVVAGASYYLGSRGRDAAPPGAPVTVPQTSSVVGMATPAAAVPTAGAATPAVAQAGLFTGKLTRLTKNLELFTQTADDKANGVPNEFTYYDAGKFARGKLKDYTRVIAIRPAMGPGDPSVYVLATKDYQSYVLDDPKHLTTAFAADDWQNPYSQLDKAKIASVAVFDTEHPVSLPLDATFALYGEKYPVGYVQTGKKDGNGNILTDTVLETDVSKATKLTSPVAGITMYFLPMTWNTGDTSKLPASEQELMRLRQKYLAGSTEVSVFDSAGLPMLYAMTTAENIKTYEADKTKYDAAFKIYLAEQKKFENKERKDFPTAPDWVNLPSLGFTASRIKTETPANLFRKYETAVPGACSETNNSRVVNMAAADLVQLGSVGSVPVFALKDKTHELVTLAFKNKLGYYDQDTESWAMVNKGMTKPTQAEYAAKNPLLFIKNYWGQWVALGEYDIMLPGGCGKPVVYLYPEKTTDVSVRFTAPVRFTADIPTYGDSWLVTARPDGSLVNRKPELTDCAAIDTSRQGSEYAGEACRTNTYPYLYWAGSVISRPYPAVSGGWVVGKTDVSGFLSGKLTEMGLNGRERADFLEYWVPELLGKNAPYYRIAFLQTKDLNGLFPMDVNPVPQTTFRIFLDYVPLTAKPDRLPQPQTLDRLVRNGFTLVEWGGLKRP